jgi:DNA-binding protein H-NS
MDMSEAGSASDATLDDGKSGVMDFSRMSITALKKVIADAEAAMRAKIEEEKAKLVANFEREAARLGLSPHVEWSPQAASEPKAELRKRGRRRKGELPVKYRGPNGEEWSGMGRPGKWVRDLKDRGEDLERYRIEQ